MIIIHMDTQQDTHVLDVLYKGFSESDNIIMVNPTRDEVEASLNEFPNDSVMLIGHGDGFGLWSWSGDLDNDSMYVIDGRNIDLLHGRDIIGIWCYASEFAKRYNLRGFFTYMFVSNSLEAKFMGFGEHTNEYCNEQNIKFCEQINHLITENVNMADWTDKLTHDNVNFVNFNYNHLQYFYGH